MGFALMLAEILFSAGGVPAAGTPELPAFPGAEGFGALTPGGRGGRVIKVTNLNKSGPGSLQAACSAKSPRIVVFDVSGVIRGNVVITEPHVTIAGQTSPGGGITINGMLSTAYRRTNHVHDVVVRFLRVRARPGGGAAGDAIQFSIVDKAVIDHVSCSWAEDETIDIFSRATNVSIQWCTIEESSVVGHQKGRHNYGLIAGRNSKRISLHHNLFAHHGRRCPAIGGGPFDFRNNVVYNFRDGLSHEGNYSGTPGINLIGNYYKRGPSDPKIFPFCFQGKVPYYLRDNFIDGVGLIQDPWAEAGKHFGLRYYAKRGTKQEKETPVAKVTTHPPQQAYELVLKKAGCFPRDSVTRRIIRDVPEGTGSWGRHEPADLMEGLNPKPPPKDSDGDGMPDEWEKRHGLDPGRDDHNSRMKSGYTAVEEYLNELAAKLTGEKPEAPKEKRPGVRPLAARKRRASSDDPLAGYGPMMEDARKRAASGEFEEAAGAVESEARRAESEGAKEALAAVARGFRATAELRRWVIEGAAAGTRGKVWVDFMGRPMRAEVKGADAAGLRAVCFGEEMRVPWEKLSPKRLLVLARRYAREPSAEQGQLLEDFSFAFGISAGR